MFEQYKDQYMSGELDFLDLATPQNALEVLHKVKEWDREKAWNDDQTKLRALLLAMSNCGHNLEQMLEDHQSLPESFWNGMAEGLIWEVQIGRMSEWEAYSLGEQRAAREVISWMTNLIQYAENPLPKYWRNIDNLIKKLDEYDRQNIIQFVTEWINQE